MSRHRRKRQAKRRKSAWNQLVRRLGEYGAREHLLAAAAWRRTMARFGATALIGLHNVNMVDRKYMQNETGTRRPR